MRHYRVGEEALFWQDEGEIEQSLPYSGITCVEGKFTPSRVQLNRYCLRIHSRTRGPIDITNTTYRGFGDFQENNETFAPFIKELHQKMAQENNNVIFKKGISWLGYYASIVTAVLLLLVLMGAGYFLLMQDMIMVVIIKAGFILYYYPSLLRYIRENKPGLYDPFALPSEICPDS